MPKNRQRAAQRGAKSIAIRTKHKIGGRKSGVSANQLSVGQVEYMLTQVRKRDKNKLRRFLGAQGQLSGVL